MIGDTTAQGVLLSDIVEIRSLHPGGPQASCSPRRNRFERSSPSRSPPHSVPRIPHQPRPYRSHTTVLGANPSRGRIDIVQVGLLRSTGVPHPELPVVPRNVSSVIGGCFLHSREFPCRKQVSSSVKCFLLIVNDVKYPATPAAI